VGATNRADLPAATGDTTLDLPSVREPLGLQIDLSHGQRFAGAPDAGLGEERVGVGAGGSQIGLVGEPPP